MVPDFHKSLPLVRASAILVIHSLQLRICRIEASFLQFLNVIIKADS